MTHTQSTFAIGDFWRFWVVHLWVEDFLELFTTMLVALIFVLMGIVSERFATRLIYFDVMLYSVGGVVGTLHHCYFSGGPAVEMALGAFFSAAEVIPLTLLTVEAWSFLQLGNRQQVAGGAAFPHRWAVMFLASVGFWNFLGAGVFGFLINMPIVSYYEIGTLLTSNHGHAAFMGVYGMLALALLVFCTRYLARPEDWSEGLVRFSFWATNVGLMLMILGHLFPLGVLQLGDVVTNGYWHARTEWFRNYPWLSWARMPGDVVFMAGSAPLVWLTLKVALRTRKTPAPVDQTGAPSKPRCIPRSLRPGPPRGTEPDATGPIEPGESSSMLPTVTAWGFALDLGLVLLLAYLLVLWLGGWFLEFLARAHFHRAQRYAHTGFAYDVELDRYECPQGELLTLHTFDDRNKLAIYKAPASSCNECVLKAFCAPHDEGRHVYRSLAEFHETDVGRFHRWLSLIILAVALAFSAGGMLAWWNKPGEWLLVIATGISLVLLWLDAARRPGKSGNDADPVAAAARDEWWLLDRDSPVP